MFENISRRQFVTGSAAAMLGLGLVGCGGNGGGESAEGGDASGAIKVGIMARTPATTRPTASRA